MAAHISIDGVKAIAARAEHGASFSWVALSIEARGGRTEMNWFMPMDMAEALANAINYANASASVQTNHDKRLSDAGIQEYRDLMANIPEGV